MMAMMEIASGAAVGAYSLRLVRHNDDNETVFRSPEQEADAVSDLIARSDVLGARLQAHADSLKLMPS
jgi:hypothetical protein